jgi:predicted transcriptional regulator
MMTILSEQEFFVLNGTHLKKMATADEIASAVGLDPSVVKSVLNSAASAGLLMMAEGRYLLLPEGTSAVHEYYRIAYEPMRSNEAVLTWYERFETINEQFIKQVSEWQSNDGDERIQSRLIKTVERLSKNLQELTPLIPRYESYLNRFSASVARIDEGEREFVCTPTIDSVHNIWFEFHEDILSVIGRPRDT